MSELLPLDCINFSSEEKPSLFSPKFQAPRSAKILKKNVHGALAYIMLVLTTFLKFFDSIHHTPSAPSLGMINFFCGAHVDCQQRECRIQRKQHVVVAA